MNLTPAHIDFTTLNPNTTLMELEAFLNQAIAAQYIAVCVSPCFISVAQKTLESTQIKLGSVSGFPNGDQPTIVKLNEIKEYIALGIREIDFVINRHWVKSGQWHMIERELKDILDVCHYKNITSKWIVESSELSEEELLKVIDIANSTSLNFMKTSTGIWGKADINSVKIMKANLKETIEIKASGGINTKELAQEFIDLGVKRIGTSTNLF
ncbi:MAG: deoxyribose-phosphate aldolase [Chitinophagales bacterium]|jgi:deoxyribose-phosphate aldolase|nr:deoxyribose-phosphate aldolase [Chitinophagales bacterium]